MNNYEIVIIARQDLAPAQVETLAEKFIGIIKDQGGQIIRNEYCGLRTLAYLIKKNRRGHYVVLNTTAPAAAIKEVERVMRINEDILRFQTIAVEEHEKGPSAILKASRYQRDDYSPSHERGDRDAEDGDSGTEEELEN
ncbi:MAG: 30S ribosomal protein S6 [Candidatus Paracaedimonas acanthamoebae]|uniref:Small ribosomal subunit protein bS6 n=1 Tax=Candidatus Paracaedimonas acanthamoebae TaxID=244581 RepID=A0A8J7TSX4_9PROT|nr:30S ribosomal protein S6 [Candidatus Paracaedimonas acanthamoebae]